MNPDRPHFLELRSPDGRVLFLPLAGPATRFVAWLIDLGMCFAVLAVFNIDLRPRLFESAEAAQAASAALFFMLPVVYGFVFEACWRGQTPGKRWLRLRVMDAGGARLTGWQIAVRNLSRIVDALPQFSLVGGAACLGTVRTQRVGDLAARTVVVRDDREPAVRPVYPSPGHHNPLRDHPGLAARLCERIGPQEAVLALRTLWRRDELDPGVRADLFGQFAARFRAAMPLPAVRVEDLSDEQQVGHVVEILFDPMSGNWE